MAKLKSPLLSFSAHGTLGDVLVFFDRHGKSYARSKPKDPVSLSLAQSLLRDCFASAAISAHSLTQGQKDSYAAVDPNSAFCPWWNNFIGQYIEDNYEGPDVAKSFIKTIKIVIGTIPNGDQIYDQVCAAHDPDYTAPILLGFKSPNEDPRNCFCITMIPDSTHVRFNRSGDPKIGDLTASVLVLEFEPDFVVSIQNKNIAFESGETVATEGINAVDINKTILFPCGKRSSNDVGYDKFNSYVDFLNNTTLRATRLTSGSFCDVRVCIIELI
jgi:hypothetical protein